MRPLKIRAPLLLALLPFLLFVSCSKKYIGWGVLLWYTDDPEIPSGTVLPIQVRSNIEQAWIAVVPKEYRTSEHQLVEIPLPHLEFFRSKGRAEKYLTSKMGGYAQIYAETTQDGLPIRDKPENNGRRTYRLKEGEIIKILEKVDGVAAISSTGAPLEGDWFKVLTKSGSAGYCFSYRLRLFEHLTGALGGEPVQADTSEDKELELILTRPWYPEYYRTMIDSGRINLDLLSKNYSFTAGINNGKARIFLENTDMIFPYSKILKTGNRSWNFAGSSLNVTLQSESVMEAHWEDAGGIKQTAAFVTLPMTVENIVIQERERRQNKYQALYVRGPGFESANYGALILTSDGQFTWDAINTLPGEILPAAALGSGTVDMDYYLSGEMAERFTGALGLRLTTVSGIDRTLVFAYTLDTQGLRMEFIPPENLLGRSISRRAPLPFAVYFNTED